MKKQPCVCVWIVSSHIFTLLNVCGCHMPIKVQNASDERVQVPGKGETGSHANLAAHGKDFKSAIKKIITAMQISRFKPSRSKGFQKIIWMNFKHNCPLYWMNCETNSELSKRSRKKRSSVVLPMKQAERRQPNIRLGEPQFLVHM